MKATRNFLRQGICSLFAPSRDFFSARTGTGRLLAAAFLLLGGAGTASAQQGNDCYAVLCPANQTRYACTDPAPLGPYPIVILTNQCPAPPPLLLLCNPGPDTPKGPGVYPVRCTAVAGGTVIAQCDFTVTIVLDNLPPQIECPGSIVAVACPSPTGGCGRNISYPPPLASDISGVVSVTCTPPSGSFFPCAITTVTCVATNPCGKFASCGFEVRVIPGGVNPPTLQCPADLTATTCSNCAVVNYPAPAVNNGVLTGCTPAAGACFPIGSTTVTCTASNDCGGPAQCSFKIIVRTVPPAVVQCPANPIVTLAPCTSNCVPVLYPAPVVTGGALVGCDPPSGACLPVGTRLVSCRATNACGQVAACEFNVQVLAGGSQPPRIQCPQDITTEACSSCQIVSFPPPVISLGVLADCTPPSGTCFPIGSTYVICRATNSCGDASLCEFIVTVRLRPPVSVVCPDDITVATCANCQIVNYPAPLVSSGMLTGCTPPFGTCFPIGDTSVTCRATNDCGGSATCKFMISVRSGGPCLRPPPNMVLWLPFDEPAGPLAHNIVPGALNGTQVNGPESLPGQHVLNSLCFDGVNDYVRVPNYAAITLGTSHFSIDTWALCRDTAGGRRVIVSKVSQVPGGIAGYEYYLQNGVMNLLLRTPAGALNFNSIVGVPLDNNWHFLAVTVERGAPNMARFYLDGNLVSLVNGTLIGSVANASPLHVGSLTFPVPGDWFLGCLDELEIFRRILTPLEIQKLWQAGRAGKCKIKCSIPWDVPFLVGSNYVTVRARIWNFSGVPQPILWDAAGPMPIPAPNGFFILPPFTCTNVPIQLCRPTNPVPVGRGVPWTFAVSAGIQCPQICTGSVINPGPVVVVVPTDPTSIPGTNRTRNVRISLNGLPPGQPVRLRAIGPDMEPDTTAISLNGLPPGVPWVVPPGILGGGGFLPAADGFDVPVKFVDADPIGLYTLLLEADLDGDGGFDTVASFDVENPVVPPPTLAIRRSAATVSLDWQDEGDGLGTIESTDDVISGSWAPVPGGVPGISFPPLGPQRFYRVNMPTD